MKATSVQHAMCITVSVGQATTWRPNKQPSKRRRRVTPHRHGHIHLITEHIKQQLKTM